MRRFLVWVGLRLALWGGWTPPVSVERHVIVKVDRWGLGDSLVPYVERARVMAAEQDRTSARGTSGEFKRHWVYARLIKEFPDAPKRDLALAIELALR